MPIREVAQRLALDADALEMITQAYDEVRAAMGLNDRDDPFCRTVAKEVVDAFERGERSRQQLIAAVLTLYRKSD